MSILGRIGKIANGFTNLGTEIGELVWDTVRSPFTEDEYDGVAGTIVGITQDNLISGVLASAVGEGSPLEATVGAIPEKYRTPVRTFSNEVLGAVDAWQDDWIERPLAAAAVGYSVATQSGLRGWVDSETWGTAWNIASEGLPEGEYDLSQVPPDQQELFTKQLSLGRAVAFAVLGTDVLNPNAAVEAAQSGTFNLISGAVDFGETIFLDPLLAAGKPLQAIRAGRLTVGKSTDVNQMLRRNRRGDLSPTRSLTGVRRRTDGAGEKTWGYTNKLTQSEINNFTTKRANQVVQSDGWINVNNAIDELPAFRQLNDGASRTSRETQELHNQLGAQIRELVGDNRITAVTAMALAQARNQTMRTNHYRYMMGDQSAYTEAANAAVAQARRLAEGNVSGKVSSGKNLNDINDLDGQIAEKRKSVSAAISKYKTRAVEAARQAELGDAAGPVIDVDLGPGIDNLFDAEELNDLTELDRLLRTRKDKVEELRDYVQGDEDWDFGFVYDLKTRFDDAQVDNFAASNLTGANDELAKFFSRNAVDDGDLLNAGIDRWLLDSIDYEDVRETLFQKLGEATLKNVDDATELGVERLMRGKADLQRQIYAPLAVRANNSFSGVAGTVINTSAKAIRGRRIVQVWSENTAQRFFQADDLSQASNQFERMLRDATRVMYKGRRLMETEEMDRYMGDWINLPDADQRLRMFQALTETLNERLAKRVYPDSPNAEKALLDGLNEQLNGANVYLGQAKPSGGLFGVDPKTSQISWRDENGSLQRFGVPLTTQQLAAARMVPRYDLIKDALAKIEKQSDNRSILKNYIGEEGWINPRKVPETASLVADNLMKVWRPAVLLRPAWPLRVVGDEALRAASVVGAFNQLRGMRAGMSDMRVEFLRRRGIDIEEVAVSRMRRELREEGVTDLADDADVYFAYRNRFSDDAIDKLYKDEIYEAWGKRRHTGLAARSMAGFLLFGPLGAVGGGLTGVMGQSKTARRLAQRQIGEAFAQDLKSRADDLLEQAVREGVSPERVAELRHTASLLMARETHIKKMLKKYELDKDSVEGQILTVADAAGARLEQAGRAPTMIAGTLVRHALGDETVSRETMNQRISADRTTSRLIEGASTRELGRNFEGPEWQVYTSQSDGFVDAWNRTTNRQWKARGNADSPSNQYLREVWSTAFDSESAYKANLVRFMNTPKGRQVLDALGVDKNHVDNFVDAVAASANDIMPQFINGRRIDYFDGYRDRLSSVDSDDIEWREVEKTRRRITDTASGRDELTEIDTASGMNMTRGPVEGITPYWEGGKNLQNLTNEAFKIFATLPTDNLSRLPYFRASYDQEVARRLGAYVDPETGTYRISGDALQDVVDKIEMAAREKALADVRYLLYDLTESTRMQESLSNMMPFLGAWQEVISRWIGITKENPAYVARVLDNFNSIPVTEDDEGNRWMILRMPTLGGATGTLLKPFVGKQLSFSQDAMSMLSSGGPGFGPLVTMPITEIAVQEPTLEETLEFMWPYGLPQGDSQFSRVITQITPAWVRRAKGAATGSDEQERIVLSIMRDALVLARQTESTDPQYETQYQEILSDPLKMNEFMGDLRSNARHLLAARAFASMVLPTSMKVDSPYQMYLDNYRKLREEDPINADDRFIENYGPEFFGIVQRTTKTNNGVSPTIESWKTFQEYQPLIEAYPEIGGLVTGNIGSTTVQRFNEAVYRRQQSSTVAPGSEDRQRERVPLEDFLEGPDVKEGWEFYRNLVDIRDGELTARKQSGGSGSINSRQNQDVRQVYDFELERLRFSHPAWWRAFNVQDKLKDQRKFEALREVAQDTRLVQREDVEVLVDYLDDRETIIDELKAREAAGGSSQLSATANQDVAELWDYMRMQYRSILVFTEIFDRFLNRDEVDDSTWSKA